ncbi:MAG: hypothetical protein U5K54_01940 [Cytophagales bacterium]|nr:hypothetical protein [Cytophagales bacterium]
MKKQIKNDPANQATYKAIFKLNTSLDVLLGKHLIIEFSIALTCYSSTIIYLRYAAIAGVCPGFRLNSYSTDTGFKPVNDLRSCSYEKRISTGAGLKYSGALDCKEPLPFW